MLTIIVALVCLLVGYVAGAVSATLALGPR